MSNFPAVILAAGQSSRFWPLNIRHKSLLKIMGQPLIWYTIEGLRKSGIKDIFIMQGRQKDVEKELKPFTFSGVRIKYIVQTEPRGMGNALWQVRSSLKAPFFVLNAERADAGEIIKKAKIIRRSFRPTLVGQRTDHPELYGIFRLKGKRVLDLIEKPQKGKAPSDIRVVGIYLLEPKFFKYYSGVKKEAYDFERALSAYVRANEASVAILSAKEEVPSLKYPWHLFQFGKYLFDQELKPYIAKTAQVAKNAVITGKVHIGNGVRVSEGAVIKGPCYIGDECFVGNNALVRDYTNLEGKSVVGANAELARSIFQEGVHCHSGFLGDSIFDKGCRIGAGTITANVRLDRSHIKPFVGEEKIDSDLTTLGSIVGQATHIGVHASLMPGVLLGSRCQIGPHSVVRKNVPDDTLFYSEFKTHQFKKLR